jgi:hypothetical protein
MLVDGGSAGAGLLLLLPLMVGGTALHRVQNGAPKPWNGKAFKANYVGSQLKERDKTFATLTLPTNWRTGQTWIIIWPKALRRIMSRGT